MNKPLPKDWYDKFERIFHVNGYTFSLSSDVQIYLIQQCGFTKTEAAQYIIRLEKV